MREIRLLPLVIVAVAALLGLKAVAILFDGRSPLGGPGPAMAQEAQQAQESQQAQQPQRAQDDGAAPPAQQEGDAGAADAGLSVDPASAEGGAEGAPEAESAEAAEERSLLERVLGGKSRSRDAILESLSERRKELEDREAELDLRENLLKAAEQRLEKRIGELKELESRLTTSDDERRGQDAERIRNLVVMYENMKPKDAARIFNRLDMPVVVRVATAMNARQMSAILAEMDSEVAQRLTLELSTESIDPIKAVANGGELPKIVGTRPAN